MFLYHGTDDFGHESILKDKQIKVVEPSETTLEIDECLERILDTNPRNGCIYLYDKENAMGHYYECFKVSIDDLNENLLYVANSSLADDIFVAIRTNVKGRNEEILKTLCQKYNESIISYTPNHGYKKAEYLYFGNIDKFEDATLENFHDFLDDSLASGY